MSTFAVFGMTRDYAIAEAKKKVPSARANKDAPGGVEEMPMAEWVAMCERAADRMMEGDKVKQLSPLFDAPQFCEQFIAMARASSKCRDMRIRAKAVMTGADGKPLINKKTKAPKRGWQPYPADRQSSAA